jgi:hypothetical protein
LQPERRVAIHTPRASCGKDGKTRIFAPVREPSGEFRFNYVTAVGINRSTHRGKHYMTVQGLQRSETPQKKIFDVAIDEKLSYD